MATTRRMAGHALPASAERAAGSVTMVASGAQRS